MVGEYLPELRLPQNLGALGVRSWVGVVRDSEFSGVQGGHANILYSFDTVRLIRNKLSDFPRKKGLVVNDVRGFAAGTRHHR